MAIREWQQLTWTEIRELREGGIISAVLPVGATEQHGPHLGCGVDSAIATRVCRAAIDSCAALLLPTLPYGCSIGHSQRWPGTLALQPKTLIDLVYDIGHWLYTSGFKKLFIVNGHVTNHAPLRCALEMLRAQHDNFHIALINTPEISERVKKAHTHDASDWHANEAETSLMMACTPELVRAQFIGESDDPDRTEQCVFAHPVNRTSKNGVTGKPSAASTERGEALFRMMVEDLREIFQRGVSEKAPLNVSYFDVL